MTAIVLLGQVVTGRTPGFHVNRVIIEPCIARIEQPRPLTRRPPPLPDFPRQRLRVGILADKPQLMGMGVPAIIAVGDLERPDKPLEAIAALELLPCLARPQARQRIPLLFQELIDLVP